MTDNELIQNGSEEAEKGIFSQPKHESARKERKADSELAELKSKLEEKEQEAKENYDRYLRSVAELENFKKRTTRQMDEFRKFANDSLIMELLTVVDNLERAIASAQCDESANAGVIEGVRLTLDEILKILDKFGVKPVPALETEFDPTFHEAVMQEEAGSCPPQTVVKELQKGYLLHDRLLRPAKVVVSK